MAEKKKPETTTYFNKDKFAEIMSLYRINHKKMNLREAAKEIGISFATLNRIEARKALPDIETYYKCCNWCNYGLNQFFYDIMKTDKHG